MPPMTREKSFMEFKKNQRIQTMLFLSAFVVALAFRFINLGVPALSDMEAEIALEAQTVAQGMTPVFSEHIGYVGLTSLPFFLFTAGNFWARFWPALIGSMIVFIPFLFRRWIGHLSAIIMAFILAISPELVGLSRIIRSPMMAMVFLFLGIAFFIHRKPVLLGVVLAFGMMSGASFWLGGFIFGISYLLSTQHLKISETLHLMPIANKGKFWLYAGFSYGLTILIVGTCFLMAPAGLTGLFSGLIEFFLGFGVNYVQPYSLMPMVLLTYMVPALVLGLWGGLRGMVAQSKKDLFLLSWFLLGLAVILLLPGSQPADMLWVSLPLWALAARFLARVWQAWHNSKKIVLFTAILTVVSLAFLVLSLRSLVNFAPQDGNWLNGLIAIVAGIALIVAILLLVRFGWSGQVALTGFMIGAVAVLGATLISSSVNTSGINPNPHYELWYPQQAYQTPEWLMTTIAKVVDWNASGGSPVEIAVIDGDTPAMRWVLRHQQPVNFVPFLPPQSQVGLILSDDMTIPEIADSYRGQDLVISRTVPWEGLTARQYLTWWLTGEVPTIANQVIIWVRTDLMPDANSHLKEVWTINDGITDNNCHRWTSRIWEINLRSLTR